MAGRYVATKGVPLGTRYNSNAISSNNTCDTPRYENEVPPYEVPECWELTTIEDVTINRDSERIPLSLTVRKKQQNKIYDYYGAAGVIDKVENYLFDERLLLVGEDGANLLSRSKDNAFFAEGKYWVNNHAHVLDCPNKSVLDYVAFVINSMSLENYITGSAQPKLTQDNLNKILIPLPPEKEQHRIIESVNNYFSYISLLEGEIEEMDSFIMKAKSKILDLAIHGKLVPQDPNDEPAIELLRRINPNFEPCDKAHYGNLPDTWCWAKLGTIGKWQSGATPSRLNKDYYGGDIPWLKTGDLNDDYIYNIPEHITQKALEETSVKLNPKGSVLIAMYGATIGKIGILTFPATTNQACCACVNLKGVEQKYLYYFLLSYKQEFIRLGGGGAQPNISKEKIAETFIPVPPIKEQTRIIAKIEKLFTVINDIIISLNS